MSKHARYVSPEWAAHAAIWVGWPHLRGEWGDAFDGARAEITRFVEAVCHVTPVRIACGSREAYGSAWFAFEADIAAGRVSLHTLPTGDIWLRDTGPLIAHADGAAMALDFAFNGWGGKYDMPGDTMTASAIASVEQIPVSRQTFILEGGAVDLDGAGRLLTTRQCLLNPNRNEDWDQGRAEAALIQAFGVTDILWLDQGLQNDHTDGHIDNIARFIGPGRVLCQSPSGEDDPNADALRDIEKTLKSMGLEVGLIPSPGKILDLDGEVMPASHMNFVISNQHLFLPIYELRYGQAAMAALEAFLPGVKIIGLPARSILAGGGAFHCMTQQIPRLEE